MERLLEVLDYASIYDIDSDNTTVSFPRPVLGKNNTEVDVSGRLDSGTYGQRVFSYNRIDLSFFPERQIFWKSTDTTTIKLLNKINSIPFFTYVLKDEENEVSRQGYLKSSDIVEEAIVMSAGQTKIVKVKAHPNSFVFIGELAIKLVA